MARLSPVLGAVEKELVHTPLEPEIVRWGQRIFSLMGSAVAPSWLGSRAFYSRLMSWAMHNDPLKIQLFRFIDVLPSLGQPAEVTHHLQEYLADEQLKLPSFIRLAIRASAAAPWVVGLAVKKQVSRLARQFMLGNDPREIVAALRQRHEQNVGFTLDLLGETVVSEVEAEQYARRYLDLMELLARETVRWPGHPADSAAPEPLSRLNLSIKVSALSSQIHPTDPETAIEDIARRLRPILRRAKEVGALINLDMEQYALKDLTLRLFKEVFSEPEFAREPACGLALQAYLRDCEQDLHGILRWARDQDRRVTVRLVKGAYWDYETVVAEQKGWPVPVFKDKAETDTNFERLSLILLENERTAEAAFGTHNVRSIAHVLAQAERLGLPPRSFEFQMLYGMADATKTALVQLGYRVREYCPVGELLPGMAYLVRRLLENTANEGFLAQRYANTAGPDELLRSPHEVLREAETDRQLGPSGQPFRSVTPPQRHPAEEEPFRNEPPTDFTLPVERERMRAGLQTIRGSLPQRHPLMINNKPVQTQDWLVSLNPANQQEVIGYSAQASLSDAEAALAAARAAQVKWARTPADERAELIERVADRLRQDRTVLCALEILEAGKNWMEADADVAEAIDFCNFYAAVMRQMGCPHPTQRVAGESNLQHWWPRGVGLVIAPWNFPLAILTGMATAAVVTGNTVIMKPSDQTPVIAARLMHWLVEAGLPEGVVNLVTGPGAAVGAHLVAHPQVDFIAFTGSKEVGLKIWETAGRTLPSQAGLKKVICEMGGKNAVIVDSDADLDEAVTGTVTAAFGYQGQKCSALSRLIVLTDIYDRFLARLVAATASLRVGPAELPGSVIGPVISRQAQERILNIIEAAKSDARLVWQGQTPEDPNACYVPPVIFGEVPPASHLFREEIFGPVLAVTRAKDFEHALALANESEFALTGGLYSRSPTHIDRVKSGLVCGNLYINRSITGAIVGRQPFGGFRMSGGGTKAGGREYLENFMVPRIITENCLRRGFAPKLR